MAEISRTESFNLAYRFVTETHLNVFLTGKAGTGKTTFLRYLRENSNKNIVVAAPTGVAAINAGGVTLHSLFQLPFAPFIPGKTATDNTLNKHPLLSKIKFNKTKRKILQNMDLLVIDEVSMVSSNTLDSIDLILKGVRRDYSLPFGGVQVLFIGDLHQLPPVVKREHWNVLKEVYPSFFFFDSLICRQQPPVMVELTKVFRQKETSFVDILNGVRDNTLTPEQLELLNTRIQPNFKASEGYITLSTHNAQADSINQEKMDEIKEKPVTFSAIIEKDFPESMYPVDHDLVLKKGAQVMFVKNDVEDRAYFNGKIGTITHLTNSEIWVLGKDDKSPIKVKREKWENVNYKVDPITREVEEEVLGSFEQYPLRMAWAITIHKSQGLTFDKLVVDSQRAFANGQVYVALSRCTSLEGLVLTSPISQSFLGASASLKNWKSTHYNPDELPEVLKKARIETVKYEMIHAFDWSPWLTLTRELRGLVMQDDKLGESVQKWVNNMTNDLQDWYSVANKFQANIIKIVDDPSFIDQPQTLSQRLKDAADYFCHRADEWMERLKDHPIQVKTKKAAIEFDETMEELSVFLHDLLFRFNYFQKGEFDLGDYLENGKVNKAKPFKVKSAYLESTSGRKLVSLKDVQHVKLYQQLAAYRKEKAEGLNVPVYRIFTNQTIKNLSNQLPKTESELGKVSGIGGVKVKQFGEDLLNIINAYIESENISSMDLFE